MSRLVGYLVLLLTAACGTLVPPPEAQNTGTPAGAEAISAYARVLERFVDDRGRVDFEALSRNRGDLDAYVRFIASTPLASFSAGDERLAHFINSYNALSMYNVITSGIPQTNAGWRKIVFFGMRKFLVGGKPMSLYAYENDFIRKVGDPRIHFALNCSAVSCPVLPRRPFEPGDLQESLEREARRFFAARDHLRVDQRERVVNVSAILRFYREDFGDTDASLIRYINRYARTQIPEHFAVRFISYDWTIADSRRGNDSQGR